ncbi:aspartate/glutamate racemase family protein [Streptomyces sp. P38-E01]|uniref:Aspartate/glutamate racemase family protein n=1 Tax=Streptomyces tardus TaxID=2780544 RepID=A0A949JR96_9ACTN|nr:aspartate/glutamate racemase family protein [Streptomyces tardus]MBU7598765.1 aspartate/glutamate racemase family protein [Streptomyces tardus]
MDVSFLGGPQPQRGVGIVAPFDFALDRELWRWVPDDVSLHLTRTPFVPVEVSLDQARLVSEHETLRAAVRALHAVSPEVVAYACTSGSFVGGGAGERGMRRAMEEASETPAVTTSGALLEALREIGARRIAVVTPYTRSVTASLEDFLGEAGVEVTGRSYLGLTSHIWRVPYRDVVEMAREAATGAPDALFISCTNLPTFDVIPQLEAELRMPVLSANQVTVWGALRHIGKEAVGPYQALLDPAARTGPVAMTVLPSPTPPLPPPAEDEPPEPRALAGTTVSGGESDAAELPSDPAGSEEGGGPLSPG